MTHKRYELAFEGAAGQDGERMPRYRRYHGTQESAEREARRVYEILDSRCYGVRGDTTTQSHNPQIHHPNGTVSTVRW